MEDDATVSLIPIQEETIIVLKALAKEHIDEIIQVSKEMNEKGEGL